MRVIIRLPRFTTHQSCKPDLRNRSRTPIQAGAEGSTSVIERLFFLFFLSLPFITLIQTVLARTGESAVTRPFPAETVLSGPRWVYTVPFEVQNKAEIEQLIQCESRGLNISVPDSDGITSDGILQFHRGPADTIAAGTWKDFSRASGIVGSPMHPADAIRMTDWAISHGRGPHWSCWHPGLLSVFTRAAGEP